MGILGVFLYGVISGRAMSVAWQHPCPFDLIFDSPRIDWSQRYIAAASPGLALYENATLVAQRKHTNVLHLDGPHIDAYFSQEIMRDLWNPKEPWLRVRPQLHFHSMPHTGLTYHVPSPYSSSLIAACCSAPSSTKPSSAACENSVFKTQQHTIASSPT